LQTSKNCDVKDKNMCYAPLRAIASPKIIQNWQPKQKIYL